MLCQNKEQNYLSRAKENLQLSKKTINLAYPNRHIDIKIPHGLGDHVILQHTL